TVRQAKTWSYTAIIGHRRLRKGILNNPIYVGQLVWNRSEWRRHPVTKRITYRVRPKDDWITRPAPELRVVPQDLWERVQVRLALHDVPRAGGARNVGKHLLSGFVKCAECRGSYVKSNASYRCGNHRNRGDVACTNRLGVTATKLERIVLQALREKLYTPANLRRLIAHVRDELLARAKQEGRPADDAARTKQLHEVEREIANIKNAVKLGKATNDAAGDVGGG
ncbi:MAG: recombinase family protein, partial [Anaerolineales bacterium]